MRIKISTINPLPKLDFWHVIHDKPPNFTVLDLQRDINQQVDLSKKSNKLSLFIDGFRLLPNSNIGDSVRDGDTITVQKIDSTIDNIISSSNDSNKKSNKRKRSQTNKEDKTEKEKKVKGSSSDINIKPPLSTKKEEDEHPKKGALERTKKRNKRRRLLKQYIKQAENQSNNNNDDTNNKVNSDTALENNGKQNKSSIESNQDNIECTTATTTGDTVKSKQLLKKNKNKKKDFLKDANEKPKMHIHFEDNSSNATNTFTTNMTQQQQYNGHYTYPDENDQQYINDFNNNEQYYQSNYNDGDGDDYNNNVNFSLNTCGAAFVTDVDTGPKKRNNNKNNYNDNTKDYQERQYPVDEAGPIIYAVNEDDDNNDDISNNQKKSTKHAVIKKDFKKVDYDKCTKLSFDGEKNPVVGDHLAIKTLDLSETYTPEISNWKEVRVLKINEHDIVVELMDQQVQYTKGKRKFDLPEDDEGEEGIENGQSQEENIRQYLYTDIFHMCKITA
ncbi:unnamed protein product [Cunninghamella blakesleeana]